jgi:hypothetical protein
MLFFRDEEQANGWCAANGVERRPAVALEQLWRLSLSWYSNRLLPDARRPSPEEMRRIFASVGLSGPFWDPESDQF